MQTKNRKINKEELELWKLVTRNDKVIGKYTNTIEEKKKTQASTETIKPFKGNKAIKEKKKITLNKTSKLIKECR